ncbi:ribosome biogenesis GTPase YlqF [Anaerotignum sp. MSJ-24]|uniref:ribosome biogenesis GTPase YlqF n=1 Tax=Anaerotignum sp. MSJ-24 TaxID=2841521 RepID=UPI001C117F62|nr:ribosome biogenesis GTPase YlqF [Anaerotignum sp. MSJ-24]MBU5464106.1 ribosome biogenesis GTPase YlqF [Anaerotignum sp. MSJ-24]
MNIQWYPGHMTKTVRMMSENISLVDVVVELIDARIPYSSKNPDIDNLAKNKKRIIVMNKTDLADPAKTEVWKKWFEAKGFTVILADAVKGTGVNKVADTARTLMKDKIEREKARGRLFVPVRAMIVGIPNVGKSTFINKTVGKTTAKTGDKPGVTKGKQWIRIKKDFELLDTPGILWPKFEDEEVGLKLAMIGSINDNILDTETLCTEYINLMMVVNPNFIKNRYNVEFDTIDEPHDVLEKIAVSRGFIKKGGEPDCERTAKIVLDEFRGGKIGKITLEMPEDIHEMEAKMVREEKEKKAKDAARKAEYKKKNNR